ncbi:MAG: substrate-binding domain-containing protein [Candidatus Izemoplasmatales bacterium]|nr:substrate-binding domain-containing protein [Candidatus Izemoplasmatales bacterium]
MIKKALTIFLLLMISLFTISCNDDKVKIGVLVYNEEDTTLIQIIDYLKENINQEYELLIYYADQSQSVQNDQFLELLGMKIDVILVNLVDRLVANTYVEKCNVEKIPLIFFNREPLYEDLLLGEDVYYVGSDAKGFGILQAQMLKTVSGSFYDPQIAVDKNNDSIIQIVFMKGEQGHQLTEYITDTCISEILAKQYKIDVLTMEFTDWKRETAKEKMAKIYAKYGNEIEVVIANSDDLALGVIDFVLENKLQIVSTNNITYMPFEIIGANANEESIEEIKEGFIYGSVVNDLKSQTEVIISLIEFLLNKEPGDVFSLSECKEADTESICLENDRLIYISGTEISKRTLNIR